MVEFKQILKQHQDLQQIFDSNELLTDLNASKQLKLIIFRFNNI